MEADHDIDVMRPSELGAAARACWSDFRAARPELSSPYFDPRYILAVGRVAPHAAVAVVRRRGRVEAFLPFQRRGGLIQPLGAPLSDYHGPVAAPGAAVDLSAILDAIGGRSLRFSGLVAPAPPAEALQSRHAMVADLQGGFDAYMARRKAAGHKSALKDKRRRARALERDHGPADFTFGADPGGVLDLILALKRRQMQRTGQHDVFAAGWTRQALHLLAGVREPDFGLRFAVMRAGGRVIAAEVGLLSGDAYHLWFPVYDPEFARYSPGALMTFETLRALAGLGVRTADFGPADEEYKRVFAEPATPVWEGQVNTRGLVADCWRIGERLFSPAPGLKRAWRAGVRRIDRIAACEPTLNGQVGAAARSVARLGRRHRRTTLGLSLVAAAQFGLLTVD